MTTREWRKSPRLVSAARKLLEEQTLPEMLKVLIESSPLYTPSDGGCAMKLDATQGEELGYIKGYHHALKQLELLGKELPAEQTPVPQNYKP